MGKYLHNSAAGAVLAALFLAVSTGFASAQTSLVGGGLTALPPVTYGPNLTNNGGFEALSGGLPAGWTSGSGWAADPAVTHSGGSSYRWTTGAPSSDQTLRLPKGIYKLSGWVKTESVSTGNPGIRLQLDFRPGGISEWFTTEVIQGTRDWTLFEVKNVVVPEDGGRLAAIRLENYAGATGTAWFDDITLQAQVPSPVEVFLLYPNFRGMLFDDGPQTLRFDVTVAPPGDDFARYRVDGALADEATGLVVATTTAAATAHYVAEIDGSAMQYGRPYLATFSLVDLSSGGVVSTYPAYRVSKAAATARASMNVSFDAGNRILLHGQPRFVLGVYDSGGGYSTDPAYWENEIWSLSGDRRLEGLRFNMYLNYWLGQAPADAMGVLMDTLQRRGVMYLQTANCFSQWAADPTFPTHASDAYVQSVGSHPGSAGYYTADECNSTLMPGIFEQYVRLRQLDPDAITFAALFGTPDIAMWRDAVDVLSSDPYPMYGAEPAGGYNHRQVADWTAQTRSAVKDARPIMTVLEFFKFTSLGRFPTRQEMRSHAYMAIVEGARGLWWWSVGNGDGALEQVCAGWCAEKVGYMDNLRAVIGELADLEQVLLADDAPGALLGNSQASTIRTKVKLLDGRGYVFAYNATNQNVSTTFTWNTAPGTVTVNAEGRTVAASGASFTDSFGPYAAHVYVLDNGGAGAGGGGTPGPVPGPLPDSGGNRPAVASWGEGRLDVFVRGSDNALWHRWYDGTWSGWESLGGYITSDPAAVSWNNGRLDVFARGADNALWHILFDGAWSGWESLGGVLRSGPAVASWAPGRLDVFVRGSDDALWHLWYQGGWGPWESLGGVITADPAAVSWSAGRIDVFARGTDDGLWHIWFQNGWSGWEPLGGVLRSAPAVASWAPGRLDVFVRGSDDGAWHLWFDGTWTGWEQIGTGMTSGIAAVSWGRGRIDLFVAGSDRMLSHAWFSSRWASWERL